MSNNMASGNALCSVCVNRVAEVFCSCTSPETFLCAKCVGCHAVKGIGGAHTSWNVNQLPYYQTPGYAERLSTRMTLFPKVRNQVQQSAKQIDLAIQKLTNEVERVIYELVQYSKKTVEELNEMKGKLLRETDEALAEVERKLVEDRPRLTSDYGKMFRELTEKLEPFELFSYSITTPKALVTLQKHLHAPLHSLPVKYAALYGNQLEIYDIKTQRTTKQTLAKDTGYVGYIEIGDNTLMIMGREVMTLDLRTCQITSLPSLLSPRSFPGVAKGDNCVYAFGGLNGNKECEKWSFVQNCWTRLPDMHYARGYFTPCPFQSLIYLAATSATDHRAVESFSPQTEICTVLPVSLPLQLTLGYNSVAFVASGELCVLTQHSEMARWRVDSESEFRFSATNKECYSRQPPLVMGKEVLIALKGTVVKFSLETYSFF